MGFGVDQGFQSQQCTFLPVWFQVGYLTSLSLSVCIFHMGLLLTRAVVVRIDLRGKVETCAPLSVSTDQEVVMTHSRKGLLALVLPMRNNLENQRTIDLFIQHSLSV